MKACGSFSTYSLRAHPAGDALIRVMQAAIAAADPYPTVKSRLDQWMRDSTEIHQATDFRLIAVGKAAFPMARAAIDILGKKLSSGIVITKDGHAGDAHLADGIDFYFAGHPLPDARGEAAAREVEKFAHAATREQIVLCLISGGASALMPAPASPVTLADLQHLTSLLLACGADIREINTLRKHLDDLKGGLLARLAAPARLVTLVLSDVLGSPLDVIASGPTVPDPSTFLDCLTILKTYGLTRKAAPGILERLEKGVAGEIPETPKPDDPCFSGSMAEVVADLPKAMRAARAQAAAEGWNCRILTETLRGEARQAGDWLVQQARKAVEESARRPLLLLAGGETTVTLRGSGTGGRNQELALSAVRGVADLPGAVLATLATDGGDGPTDAAGAVVAAQTLNRARGLGLNPEAYLENNDSWHFFAALDDLIRCGPTQTNVNDLAMLLLM